MLFEGHIFWQRLVARKIDPNKYVKGNEDILYRSWTKKYYTGKNSGELSRLQKAIKINEAAAYESASYGMFQIMGNNYKVCGYSSAKDFYNDLQKRVCQYFLNYQNHHSAQLYLEDYSENKMFHFLIAYLIHLLNLLLLKEF